MPTVPEMLTDLAKAERQEASRMRTDAVNARLMALRARVIAQTRSDVERLAVR